VGAEGVGEMKSFNRLKLAQLERLSLLIEECGEVIKAAGKVLRHGYDNFDPDDDATSNRLDLQREIGDVLCAIDFLVEAKDLSGTIIQYDKKQKRARVGQYLHHFTSGQD
jgi:NTP pyrophosphatase (non-canonical NTP hydrolase)